MRALSLLLVLSMLAACGRPLTSNESAFAAAMENGAIATDRVRFHDGHFAGSITYQRPVRPRRTCQERIWPPSNGETVTVSPGATTFFNRVLYREDLYRDDFLAGFPDQVDLVSAMLFAHEMTHVWQWQNRRRTGYHPLRAAFEHTASADPYLFEPDSDAAFLDHGFEQQGAIVEEWVCCRLLDAEAPRTERLRRMISAEMDLSRLDETLSGVDVRIPWAGAEIEGICRN
ncbi:hypothetical protein ROJ8625_03881 [Roseivivax jejudonensis]|uniref:Plant Basic Secretory Protein n=1 Tax=Roseivivax jejudonensis TaxID=1529041 RepID=A0A1X7A8H1_9RHOB|nr:hypothetical protein [Roseivivax jejudonensis]SLN72770.1 hypothetical protein ROJ8625_03881 [Roseivivax jejudonensis]